MASLKQIKKSVTNNSLLFPREMYNTLQGSIVITSYILNNERPDLLDLKKKWKKAVKHGISVNSEETFIQDILKFFDCPPIPYEYAAYVTYCEGKYSNSLVAPYVNGELLPLREDGFLSMTLRKGKIYPLSKGFENGKQHNQADNCEVQAE